MKTDLPSPSMCFEENVITGEITAISSAGGYTRLGLYADAKHSAVAMNNSLGINPEQAEQIKQEHYQAINGLRVEHDQQVVNLCFNDDGMTLG